MGKGLKYIPPEWLEPEAKEYIWEVLKELNKQSNLKKLDVAAIHMLAISYSQFIKSSKEVADTGVTVNNYRGEKVKHPSVNIAKDSAMQAMRIMVEYGLTLKSRESMSATKKDDAEDSPLAKFAKEGGKPK